MWCITQVVHPPIYGGVTCHIKMWCETQVIKWVTPSNPINSIRMWCKTQVVHSPILTCHIIISHIKKKHNHTQSILIPI